MHRETTLAIWRKDSTSVPYSPPWRKLLQVSTLRVNRALAAGFGAMGQWMGLCFSALSQSTRYVDPTNKLIKQLPVQIFHSSAQRDGSGGSRNEQQRTRHRMANATLANTHSIQESSKRNRDNHTQTHMLRVNTRGRNTSLREAGP